MVPAEVGVTRWLPEVAVELVNAALQEVVFELVQVKFVEPVSVKMDGLAERPTVGRAKTVTLARAVADPPGLEQLIVNVVVPNELRAPER